MKLLLMNGPNLNLTGIREPDIYGSETLADIEARCAALCREAGCELECFQSNHEGALIDRLQAAMGGCAGVVLNPGALAHYSYALRDARAASGLPVVEVHISDIYAREPFRAHSVTAEVCFDVITGKGTLGYELALEKILGHCQAR